MRVLLTMMLVAGIMTSSTIASAAPDGGPRLRPQDPRIVQVLKEGMARSATFRSLVERIEASQVIVYVAVNPVLRTNLSGALTWMTQAGDFRYVRASIRSDLTFNQMIATVAHELQHAVEVIDDESVVSEASLVAMYKRIGHPNSAAGPSGWETVAAQRTGFQVRRELAVEPVTLLARVSTWSQS
jgi:hypothetical protein